MLQTMAKVQLRCFSFTEAYACVPVTATAEAWAEVCHGSRFVKAHDYGICLTAVYGKIFACASAEAIAQGDCLSAEAISDVLAKAGASFDAHSTCGGVADAIEPEVVQKEIKNAEAHRKGGL